MYSLSFRLGNIILPSLNDINTEESCSSLFIAIEVLRSSASYCQSVGITRGLSSKSLKLPLNATSAKSSVFALSFSKSVNASAVTCSLSSMIPNTSENASS